ncbi:MAG: hypothetical protein SPK52_04815 [Synergistales bacterium]|nr:hypothetical protein [Bacteroidales bacterium]MDY6424706.1 hypothetical protein [Bacteroidales bacterium]MDY6435519.1 hypothetical protein [Synergistales bacterium]
MKKLLYIFILVLVLSSCDNHRKSSTEGNSVYYWKTTFSLDKTKQDFISKNNITRLYIRYFDVVLRGNASVPNATIKFKSSIPDSIQVIPAIYIMNECMQSRDTSLAEKILERILQMNATNDIKNVREIQIDCDYTKKTEHNFLAFMQQLYNLCNKHKIGLATTVRLYQLSWQEPKADRGVLMMYNTGDFKNIYDEKPILNVDSVETYLRYLKNYDLPLSAAYPLFKWDLLFYENRFKEILYTEDRSFLFSGDTVVRREPTLSDILKAKTRLQQIRKDINKEIIVFDLSEYNITRFKDEEYKKIFAH